MNAAAHHPDALQLERYELALQATHDGLWDWDVTTGVVYSHPVGN